MNKGLRHKDSQSVWHLWEDFAEKYPEREAIVHWDALSKPFRWTYGGLINAALRIANKLIHQGVTAGDVCAVIIRHNKYFYPIYMAIVAIGAVPAVLAYPNPRLHPDKFLHGLSGMAQKSGLDWIMAESDLESVLRPIVDSKQSSIKDISFPLEWIEIGQREEPDNELIKKSRNAIDITSPFLLQHSSGTTGLQKAVVLSHGAVLEHVKRYSEAIKLSGDDRIVNWLPLYHDMGLIAAFHVPLAFGIPSVQIDPFQWISAPAILFKAISEEKATLVWLPNFAYNFMADRIPEGEMDDIDLSSMRMFINCSEVVRSESHEKFINRFRKYGVKKRSLAVCYAMAETTFAVTQTEPGSEPVTLAIDRDALAKKIVRSPQSGGPERICVSSGKPISGCLLRIVDENGLLLSEDRIGTVAIKSVSLFDGYRNDPERTSWALKGGWYMSGDLGFLHEDECFIIGRADDVIIVAGRNIFPEDVEGVVNNVSGVIPGRTVAFGTEDSGSGTEDICVIAETKHENKEERDSLIMAIKKAGMDIDVTISRVYLVPSRWLIKSSSGKISRKTNKERILSTDKISE